MGPRQANSTEAPRFYPRHTKRESNSETRAIPRRRLILSTFVASFANFLVSDTVYVIHSQDVWKRVSFYWLFFSALFDHERGSLQWWWSEFIEPGLWARYTGQRESIIRKKEKDNDGRRIAQGTRIKERPKEQTGEMLRLWLWDSWRNQPTSLLLNFSRSENEDEIMLTNRSSTVVVPRATSSRCRSVCLGTSKTDPISNHEPPNIET